ncbi:MAG: alpha/beta fold hydrolase [Spirochaetes bacterium]|nr:MAG: alpha/beta fold hydrolase [Spirochaetota bacterium]
MEEFAPMDRPPLAMESIMIPVNGTDTLHLRRMRAREGGRPVLMFHGGVENGRIFYSDSGRGFAPFLAHNGYDVFVADARGHGGSVPPAGRASLYGQHEMILDDIPAFSRAIRTIRGDAPQLWVAHSYGGALAASAIARDPYCRASAAALVYLGSRRRIAVRNPARFIQIDFFWRFLARGVCAACGYLPMKDLHLFLGDDNETRMFYRDSVEWLVSKTWRDTVDGFDYGEAIRGITLPPALYVASEGDRCLGNPADVRRFMRECGDLKGALMVLGKKHGSLRDYSHIEMLTHRDAVLDHFPRILAWLSGAAPAAI